MDADLYDDDPVAWPVDWQQLDDDPPVPEGAADVDRMLRRLAILHQQAAATRTTAGAIIGRAEEWRDARLMALGERSAWLTRSVEVWARGQRSKTVELPHGTIRRRAGRPSVATALDDEGLRLLAKDHPGWVRETIAPDRNAIKAGVKPGAEVPGAGTDTAAAFTAVDDAGEIVAGVLILVPREDTVTISPEA